MDRFINDILFVVYTERERKEETSVTSVLEENNKVDKNYISKYFYFNASIDEKRKESYIKMFTSLIQSSGFMYASDYYNNYVEIIEHEYLEKKWIN